MNAAVYARVSTDDQADRAKPIEDQLAECRRGCEARGWEVVGEWIDPGISGTRWDRPGLQALLEAVKSQGIERVVVWTFSRIARSMDLLGHIRWLLHEAGAEVVAIDQADASDLERDIHGVIDAEYVRRVRRDCIRAMRAKASRQEYTGGWSLYGYRWVKEPGERTTSRRLIVPDEAALIRRVFALADPAGKAAPLAEIARETRLHRERIRRILRHPGYAGAYTYGRKRYDRKPKGGEYRPRSEWLVTWGAHEAIIPRDQWERVQNRLDTQADDKGNHFSGYARLALTGLLRCGKCGEPMQVAAFHARADGRRTYYYCCPSMHSPSMRSRLAVSRPPCTGMRISTLGLVERILERMLQQITRREFAEVMAREINRARQRARETGEAQAEVRRLEKARATLLAMIHSGEITDTSALSREYEATQRAVVSAEARLRKARLADRPMTAAQIRAAVRPILSDLQAARQLPGIEMAARQLFSRAIESVTVQPDGKSAVVVMKSSGFAFSDELPPSGGRGSPRAFPR